MLAKSIYIGIILTWGLSGCAYQDYADEKAAAPSIVGAYQGEAEPAYGDIEEDIAGLQEVGEAPGDVAAQGASPNASAEASPNASAGASGNKAAMQGRKLIRTGQLELLVEDFDAARTAIDHHLEVAGGFIAHVEVNRYGNYHNANFTIRMPAAELTATITALSALGKVERESVGTEDITRKYIDTGARLRNLKHTETRMLQLLDSHQGDLKQVLAVERELTRIRGDIEAMSAHLRGLDDRVALATLQLQVREEIAEIVREPDDIWRPMRRLGRNAVAMLESSLAALISAAASLAAAFIYALPWLVPIGLILILKPRWRRWLGRRLLFWRRRSN